MTRISRQALALGLCVIMIAVSTLSCAELGQKVREHPKAAIGAAAGTAGGLLLGGMIFRSTTGALLGGLLGGLAGGVIGEAMEAQKREYASTAKAYNYAPGQGTVVRIEKVEALPSTAKPGDTIQLVTHYALLTPDPAQEVSVTERREITKAGQLVGNPVLTVDRTGGTWVSTIPLTLPANASEGVYHVNMAVRANGSLANQATTFTVQ